MFSCDQLDIHIRSEDNFKLMWVQRKKEIFSLFQFNIKSKKNFTKLHVSAGIFSTVSMSYDHDLINLCFYAVVYKN